jgi:hypothetical protein
MDGAVHDAHPNPLTCVPSGHKTHVHDAKVMDVPLQYCGKGHARHAVCESLGSDPDTHSLQLGMLNERYSGKVHDVQLAPPARLCEAGPQSEQLAMVAERYEAGPQDVHDVKDALGWEPSPHAMHTLSSGPRT